MRGFALASVLTLAPLALGWSQTGESSEEELQRGERHAIYAAQIEWVVGSVTALYVASMGCGYGSPDVWKSVVDAIDRRYERCAPLGSPLERAVVRHFSHEWRYSRAAGLNTDAGTLAFERWLPRHARQFETNKSSWQCSSRLTKNMLNPGSISAGELDAEYSRVDPRVKQDHEMLVAMRKLGEDQKWVEVPCDEFFPVSQRTKE